MGRLSTGTTGRDGRIVAGLLATGGAELRDLPWRRTLDHWRVLVSEVMLQQTSVARVLQRYDAFVERFPTPAALAAAPLGEALALWQGLGYPRRCRNLHAAAVVITEQWEGDLPRSLDGLLALPGIGQYTARAVLAFTRTADAAVVDTNVSRVLSRLDGRSMTARELQQRADSLVPQGLAWEWNQVLMDFGATRCSARNPSCGDCPLAAECAWAGDAGVPDPAPGSAAASRPQARFEGSDRQARGRAMRALVDGPRSRGHLVDAMELAGDPDRAHGLLDALVAEGLAVDDGMIVRLP
ncbi:MAG: A/G-specific adenine glycosylase [Acidimicrobiales bacterium]